MIECMRANAALRVAVGIAGLVAAACVVACDRGGPAVSTPESEGAITSLIRLATSARAGEARRRLGL